MNLLGAASERLRQPRLRRRVLTMSDQAVSSLSNILAAVLVARSFDAPEPFGVFGLAMIVYQLVLGAKRSVVGEPLLSLYSHVLGPERRRLLPDLLGTAALISLLCLLCLAGIAVLLGGMAGAALLALAFVLPLLLVQDVWRFYFVVDRPGAALAVDVAWLLTVVVAFPLAPENAGVGWFVTVWGLGAGLGVLLGAVIARGPTARPRPLRWLTNNRETGGRFFGEFVTARAVSHLVTTALGPIAGLGAVGSVRGSQVYYGPHNTLYAGIYLAVVPEGAQARDDPTQLRNMLMRTSFVLAAIAALWMGVGMMVPSAWGEQLLGGSWEGAREIMAPMGVAMTATGVASGGFLGLRSLGDARRSLRARLRVAPWQAVCPLVGAFAGGAVGFAVGFAIGRIATAVIWWRAFVDALRDRSTPSSVHAEAPAAAVPAVSVGMSSKESSS